LKRRDERARGERRLNVLYGLNGSGVRRIPDALTQKFKDGESQPRCERRIAWRYLVGGQRK
jgi:hypothetical protein